MRKEYDLKKLKLRPNPYLNKLKKSVTIRLDEDVIDYFIKNKIFVRLIYVQYEELPASANVSLSSKDVYGNEAKITNGIDIYGQDRKTIVFKREMLIDHLFAIIIHEVPAQSRCLVYIFP